ncbi:MAG: sigma-70 family RNA polymerase sigma factor [Faecalibacterium sp.]|nr:sigma-70 family RNA polymerase sigma factor [Ruminococcus sp.]MCM1392142.1 sigma-70 family RNA polymerase sigma factor [Ruminococcus sp.]MCM1485880.1 sigma-70 family RNA polymerase sigma factor [Faecalibacterium sp.]
MTEDEFIRAVKRNNQRLFLIALSFTQNKTDSEDIIQNVFLKLWNQKEFESEEHIDKWLTRVTANESKNFIKSPFRKRRASLDEFEDTYTFDKDKNKDLFNAVMSLPTKLRTVVHMFYYEDMTVKDIAEVLRLKESAVKTRLHRARTQLKQMLGDDWNNE